MLDDVNPKEYFRYSGNRCPYCGSEKVDAGTRDWDEPYMYQEIMCLDCEKEWSDIYMLIGFTANNKDYWNPIISTPVSVTSEKFVQLMIAKLGIILDAALWGKNFVQLLQETLGFLENLHETKQEKT